MGRLNMRIDDGDLDKLTVVSMALGHTNQSQTVRQLIRERYSQLAPNMRRVIRRLRPAGGPVDSSDFSPKKRGPKDRSK